MYVKQAVKTSEYVKKINVRCCPHRGSQQWGIPPPHPKKTNPKKIQKFINFHFPFSRLIFFIIKKLSYTKREVRNCHIFSIGPSSPSSPPLPWLYRGTVSKRKAG